MKVALDTYNNKHYHPGGALKRVLWYFINGFVFTSWWFPFSALKVLLLRIFGARVGRGVTIKPRVNIKYPWYVTIGHHTWIGEGVWIDSLGAVVIGNHVVLSQGAMLLTGNHDYKKSTFDLIVREVVLEDGVWIGAQAMVCPGVTCCSHSILTVGSVATKDLEEYMIYKGNPAVEIRKRVIEG